MQKDDLYKKQRSNLGDFRFDERVVKVFDDMIKRSVPGYVEIADLQSRLIPKVLQNGTKLYDLGCSTGHSLYNLARYSQEKLEIIAVDNSPAMLHALAEKLQSAPLPFEVELVEGQIQDVQFESCSVVLLNFTLQFIPPEDREVLLKNIYNALVPGGVLLISEKVKIHHPKLNQLEIEVHHDFKRAQGYSDEEIIRKRDAIENVLIPDTIASHEQRFSQVGFQSVDVLYKWFNFASFVCMKD